MQAKTLARVETDSKGRAALVVRGSGDYVLTIAKAGYLNARSEIKIDPGLENVAVELILTENSLSQQKVTVTADAPDVVTHSTGSQATLDPTQPKEAPFRPATLTDAIPLLPGVVRASDGSLDIAGYTENHSTLLVNSVDVTDPATGDFGLSVPIDS